MDSFKDNVLNSTQPRIGNQLTSLKAAVALSVFLNLQVSFPPIFWIFGKVLGIIKLSPVTQNYGNLDAPFTFESVRNLHAENDKIHLPNSCIC